MKVEKSHSDKSTVRADGLTEAQLAKMRAIYDDPVAYAEWRVRMGLSKAYQPRPNPVMQARVARLIRGLISDLEAETPPSPKWAPPPARQLSPEELAASWRDKPATLSAEVMEKYASPRMPSDDEDVEF